MFKDPSLFSNKKIRHSVSKRKNTKMRKFWEVDWNAYRNQGDKIADAVIEEIASQHQWEQLRQVITIQWGDNQNLPTAMPEVLTDFFAVHSQLPKHVNTQKLEQGQTFFQLHAEDAMSLLGVMSLPYCYAAGDGAQVLYFSERMRNDAQKRLLETARFVFEVNQKGSLTKNALAFTTILKVRLLHATIRYHLKNHSEWNHKWGLPINQEDMMGTNLAFSLLIVRGLRKIGKTVSAHEAESYLYLWYVVGQLLGIDKAILPQTMKEATFLAQNLEQRLFKKSQAGTALMRVLLHHFDEILPKVVPRNYISSYMRYLMGDKICDLLEIPPTDWTQHLVNGMALVNTFKASFQQSDSPIRNYWEARQFIAGQR